MHYNFVTGEYYYDITEVPKMMPCIENGSDSYQSIHWLFDSVYCMCYNFWGLYVLTDVLFMQILHF